MADKLKKWLPWLIAFAAGAYAWFTKFITDNPLPTDAVDSTVAAVTRFIGMG